MTLLDRTTAETVLLWLHWPVLLCFRLLGYLQCCTAAPLSPPKWGVTFVDVLHEMGIETGRLSQETWIKAAGQSGFLFVPTEQWCPPLASIRPVRIEMGLRTVYNSVEKLLRPTDAHFMAVGVFHGTVFEKKWPEC